MLNGKMLNDGSDGSYESDKDFESDEDCSERLKKHWVKLAIGCTCGILLLPFLIICVWLICALIKGSPGDEDYKHAFEAMAPLRSVPLDQLETEMPMIIGKAPLPKQLRGVFWVGNQSASSSLCSFGGPNNDTVLDGGKPCSSGEIGSDRKYCIRVPGDRTWSLRSSFLSWVYAVNDIRYVFTFDSAEDPKYATIQNYCDLHGWLPGYDIFFFADLFDMALMENHSFPGSNVWKRTSKIAGISSYYLLVQVMDEFGVRIQPAWNTYMEYSKKQTGNPLYVRSHDELCLTQIV